MFSSPIFGDIFLLKWFDEVDKMEKFSFRLLYSEICSYSTVELEIADNRKMFSSPLFGDMFLLQTILDLNQVMGYEFSSPLFGDMFLLDSSLTI